jgi:hypothetical protein
VVNTLTLDEFGAAFPGLFKHEAWRLELLEHYQSPHFDRWLAGQPYDRASWDSFLISAKNAGKRVARVHVIPERLTPYLVHELDYYAGSVPLGEDIRLLRRDRAAGLDLPGFDFWLFDSKLVAVLVYDELGACLRVEMHDDQKFAQECCRWRDIAESHAVTLAEYGKEAAA